MPHDPRILKHEDRIEEIRNNLPDWINRLQRPHMLRHATGYALANEGTDTRLIQDFLGHASIANTVRYTRLAPGRLATVRVR